MQYRPLAASIAKWHDVSVQEQITIKGGLNRRGEVVESIRYKCADGATHTFVALHKEAMWFLKGVGGISMRKGDLKVVNVLNMLRHKVKENDFAPLGAASSPAVAGSDSQSSVADTLDDDDDPMESMISIESVADSLGDVVPRNPKQRKVDRACVQELSVPTRPACVSGASKEETQIFVYTAPDKKKQSAIHLRADCISWLLSYAADELACQGVSLGDTIVGSPIQRSPNCACPNVHLEWNFALKRWEAVFVEGIAQGEVVVFAAKDVTPALHKHLRSLHLTNAWYSKTCGTSNKLAAKEYICILCNAMHNGKLDEHNATFGQLLTVASTEAAQDGDAAEGGAALAAGGKSDGTQAAQDGDAAEGAAALAADGKSDGEESSDETAQGGAVETE